MLPRLGTKVHPQRSLLSACTAVSSPPSCQGNSKTASYACLPSPLAASDDVVPRSSKDRHHTRWVYNYPRLSFVLLFIVCTYIGGIYVSTNVTEWTLDVLGVRKELTASRQVYIATSRTLSTMTKCVDRSSLQYLASAKLQYEADSKHVQKIIDDNDKVLAELRNATKTCSEMFLTTLKEQVQTTASNSTVGCFSDNFYENMPETETVSSSRALVLAVRAFLTTQEATAANDSASKQQIQVENQLMKMWNAVDIVKNSIEKTLGATNTMASKEFSSLAPILSDSDGSGHTKQSASRLGRLGKVMSSELSEPLSLTSSTSLEAIRKAGRTLHKALEFLAGLHDGFTDVMDTVDETWELLEKQLNGTIQQAAQLQKDLAYAAEGTAQQINRTRSVVLTTLNQTQEEISTSFDILREQWQQAVKTLVQEGFTPWQRLGDQLVAELTENQRQTVRPESSIQRNYFLPDRAPNSSLEQEHAKLTHQSSRNTTTSSTSADNDDEFDIDTAVLRASLVDVGAFLTQMIFYVDVGRLTLLAADLAVGILTESYSDMPMLDIRGITTVDTIASVCEVFLCQHSLSAVCYTLVAKTSELMHVLVTFLVLFFAVAVITAGFFIWKQEHIAHCEDFDVAPRTTSPTTIQSLTRAFFENSGSSSKSVVNPLDEIQKYATIINNSIHNDYSALELDSAAVWKNQSALLDDFRDCATTTSSLVRMLQDCTEHSGMIHIDNASLSSQCLTSTLSTNSQLVTPSTAEKWSENAPFLAPSTAFTWCFPEDELLHMGREEIVSKLEHKLACATEKAVYLSCASWWLLIVVFIANRFTARMIIKAAGVYWWRFLSADRLQFVGFCQEDGVIIASDTLKTAIQRHLHVARWQIVGRIVGVGFALACVVAVVVIIFHRIT